MAYTSQQRKNHIRELQQYLHALACYGQGIPFLIADGVYGRETAMAVRAFQEQHHLHPTGMTDRATWEAIVRSYRSCMKQKAFPVDAFPRERSELSVGDEGLPVYIIQAAFQLLHRQFENMPCPTVTGIFDEETRRCVQCFQRKSRLRQTGAVDNATWNLLIGSVR